MSFYDYKCDACGLILFDVERKITENTSTYDCPICKGKMRQRFSKKSVSTFELKGKGWYKTDYKSKK